MKVVLSQLRAIARFVGTGNGDPNIRACIAGLDSAIAALERHLGEEA